MPQSNLDKFLFGHQQFGHAPTPEILHGKCKIDRDINGKLKPSAAAIKQFVAVAEQIGLSKVSEDELSDEVPETDRRLFNCRRCSFASWTRQGTRSHVSHKHGVQHDATRLLARGMLSCPWCRPYMWTRHHVLVHLKRTRVCLDNMRH